MSRLLMKLALGASVAILANSPDVLAGRGGYGGGESRGGYGGGMSHSPAFSQPHSEGSGSASGSHPQSGAGGQYGEGSHPNSSSYGGNAANSGNRSQNPNGNAGSAAAGAGYANKNNQPQVSNAGAAAAGAGYSNRNNQPQVSNAGAAAAGAGYSNRNNQPQVGNAGAAAAGAGYANRNNQPNFSNAGAAAAGAGYANRNNQPNVSPYGAAAAGAGYANRNGYNQYHPGMTNGYWNNNYGAMGNGGVAAWGTGSPAYGYGYSSYNNPYAMGMGMGGGAGAGLGGGGGVGGGQPAGQGQAAYNYAQPINTAAAPPQQAAVDQGTSTFDQARQAFAAADYPTALTLVRQSLSQMPNDTTMHEFLALALFAEGNYEQAAAPLYAVLSVGPGWDWTTLISNYNDANLYTSQLRGLESFVRTNPKSAQARFVLAYEYIVEGHTEPAVRELKAVIGLQPNDTLSAQLLSKLQPASAGTVAAPAVAAATPFNPSKLNGTWTAQPAPNAKITFAVKDGGAFTWSVDASGQAPVSISGTSVLANGVLTLNDQNAKMGTLAGQITWIDDSNFTFRAVGAPAEDPGLKFGH